MAALDAGPALVAGTHVAAINHDDRVTGATYTHVTRRAPRLTVAAGSASATVVLQDMDALSSQSRPSSWWVLDPARAGCPSRKLLTVIYHLLRTGAS